MSAGIGAYTEAELDSLRRDIADEIPERRDLFRLEAVNRLLATIAARDLRLVYLQERADLLKGEVAARDEEIAAMKLAIDDDIGARQVLCDIVNKEKARVTQLETAIHGLLAAIAAHLDDPEREEPLSMKIGAAEDVARAALKQAAP